MTLNGRSGLLFTTQEYWEWQARFEGGYGQPRPGVSAEQVEMELAAIPNTIRYTYIFKKYIGNKKESHGEERGKH